MFVYVGKLILLFVLSMIVIRFMGKGAMAQLTPYDLTAFIFLVTIAVNPLVSEKIGQTLIGIVIVTILHIMLSKFSLFHRLNQLLIGHPTILIKHGKLIKENLDRSQYSLVELLATLRAGGYPDIQEVEYAILEPTGEVSILPKKDIKYITPKDLHINIDYQGLPISVIVEGRIQRQNLKMIGKDENWLKKQLESAGHSSLNHIFYAAVRDTDHSLTVDTGKGELYQNKSSHQR